jgi:Protein of unknown function (DUF3606)
MADDKTKRAPEDAKLISLNDEYEVEYWTRKFGVTTERLVRAVHKVGNSVGASARSSSGADRAGERAAPQVSGPARDVSAPSARLPRIRRPANRPWHRCFRSMLRE